MGADFGIALGRTAKLVFSGGYFTNNDRYTNSANATLADTLNLTSFNGNNFSLSFMENNLNRKQFASRGRNFLLKAQFIQAQETLIPGSNSIFKEKNSENHSWYRLMLHYEKYHDFKRYSFGYLFEGLVSNQDFFQNYTSTLIVSPAFYPLLDSKSLFLRNFRSFNYMAIGMRHIFKIKSSYELRLEAYMFAPYQETIEGSPQKPAKSKKEFTLHPATTLGFVYHTFIGPVSINLNYYDESKHHFGVLFNIGFLLYNQRSLD